MTRRSPASGALPEGIFLRADRLTKKFGDFVAVNGVSFDIPRGKVFGFLGPNGSGKSTAIRMLTGLLLPSSGTATAFGNLDVVRDAEAWKSRLGYMSQKFSLYLDLTVEENLRFFGTVYGLGEEKLAGRIATLSQRLRFQGLLGTLTDSLSTGWRQRVALAAALLHQPALLFLDEPTGGVDPRGRRLFWDLIYDLAADEGMTVLVTTHYMDEAEQCDSLAFILNGDLIAQGTPLDLKDRLKGRLLEVPLTSEPFEALKAVKDAKELDDAYLFGLRLRAVSHEGRTGEAAALLSRFGSAHEAEPTLEDVFVDLARDYAAKAAKAAKTAKKETVAA